MIRASGPAKLNGSTSKEYYNQIPLHRLTTVVSTRLSITSNKPSRYRAGLIVTLTYCPRRTAGRVTSPITPTNHNAD